MQPVALQNLGVQPVKIPGKGFENKEGTGQTKDQISGLTYSE